MQKQRNLNFRAFFLPTIALLLLFFAAGASADSSSRKKMSMTALAGFPHPVNLGLDYRFANKWSAGLTGGYLGLSLNYSSSGKFNINTKNVEARLRFHPFSQAFFIGVAGGYQAVSGDTARTIAVSSVSVDATASASIKNYYVIPHIGWFNVTASGFTFGLEVGAYLPISAQSSVTITSPNPLVDSATTTPEYQKLQSDAQKFGDQVGSMTLPFLTALRLGWTF